MKRKIRRKRQLRIQRDKEQRRREKSEATSILLEEIRCSRNEYADLADSPEYLYVYVHKFYGWSLYRPITIVFLFDLERESVKYAVERYVFSDESSSVQEEDNEKKETKEENEEKLDPEQFLLSVVSSIRASLDVIGEAHFSVREEMEEMFNWEEPDVPYIFDGGGWVVFLKNGKRKRRIGIQEPRYYPPFLWLLRFFEDVVELIVKKKNEHGS